MAALAFLGGPSALVAAVATVLGAIFLVLFFVRGQPWGTLNDLASIVLMLATLPVVVAVTFMEGHAAPLHLVAAAIGVVGMLGAATTQTLLVARSRTYKQLLPWTLGFGGVVGIWYLLVGMIGLPFGRDGTNLSALAIGSGIGYVLIGYGFWRGNERHPLSIGGGILLLVASTWFLTWIGLLIVTGQIGFGTRQ